MGKSEVAVRNKLAELQTGALEVAREASDLLTQTEEQYEKAVLSAWDLGCGASAIGRAVGLSEGAIRGFVRRRREVA